MPNTYTQIHIHSVFTVQNRQCVIQNHFKDPLYKYITGIVENNGHKLLAINGMPDHLHVFFGMRPHQSVSDIMKQIKSGSSFWINENRFINNHFCWQEGFGAFSYHKSMIDRIIRYINNQENHHKKITFIDEYRTILKRFNVDYNERYIFKPVNYQD